MSEEISNFLSKISKWGEQNNDLAAIALVGSYARGTATPNSDVDLVIITEHKEKYLQNTEWALDFGNIIKKSVEYYGKVTSLRVFYTNGLEVEFGITDVDWLCLPIDKGTQKVIEDGFMIIYEKETFVTDIIKQLN